MSHVDNLLTGVTLLAWLFAPCVAFQLCCSTDDQRGMMSHLMVEAMNTRLGLKSVWAKDINDTTLLTILKYNPMVVDCFNNCRHAVAPAST